MNSKKNSLAFSEFVLPIVPIVRKKCTVKHYSEVKAGDVEACKKIILSGTPLKNNDYVKNNKKLTILGTKVPSISREFFGIENCRTKVRGIKPTIFNKESFEWLRECDRPVLGICAGMQVIGLFFNSSLERCSEIGMTEVETVRENPLFSSKFMAYELHNHALKPSRDFIVIAKSKKCVQGIRHKKKEIYGLLFHPEVRNTEIIERFMK